MMQSHWQWIRGLRSIAFEREQAEWYTRMYGGYRRNDQGFLCPPLSPTAGRGVYMTLQLTDPSDINKTVYDLCMKGMMK